MRRLYTRDKRKLKSQVKGNTYHPVWNENFQLLVHEPDHQNLTCILYDWDRLSPSDEIGRCGCYFHARVPAVTSGLDANLYRSCLVHLVHAGQPTHENTRVYQCMHLTTCLFKLIGSSASTDSVVQL